MTDPASNPVGPSNRPDGVNQHLYGGRNWQKPVALSLTAVLFSLLHEKAGQVEERRVALVGLLWIALAGVRRVDRRLADTAYADGRR